MKQQNIRILISSYDYRLALEKKTKWGGGGRKDWAYKIETDTEMPSSDRQCHTLIVFVLWCNKQKNGILCVCIAVKA